MTEENTSPVVPTGQGLPCALRRIKNISDRP